FDSAASYVRFPVYFSNEFLNWSARESVIDCGAYIGNTLEAFLRLVGGQYDHYWAIEPDPANFKLLADLVAGRGLKNITLLNKAVFSRTALLSFAGGLGQGSRLDESGAARVEAEAIDNLVDRDQAISFIKMDLEGGELEALKGGAATIRKYRPKLAVCAYHRADDLLVLPAYIKELVPEYRLFLRLHGYGPVDAVLYAVPANT
ncbi:MAG: FkbM family methyltransferase, partial [Candidatus Adiutrix sp.]|nr:FkbM family methyltransferase [Candidatus Adiutrix sp.]